MATKETGIQFLARLGTRPSITGVRPSIFGDQGPQPKDVIELYGDEGTGKSELLVHLICKCILPEFWNNIPLNGHSAGVIFIDTDLKFSIIRVVSVIEKYILDKAKLSSDPQPVKGEDMEPFIQSCLKRLHILRCTSSQQLLISLHNLENLICNESSISIIAIDSISAFYWLDKSSGPTHEANMKSVTEVLSKFVNTYNLILFVTKAMVYKKKGQNENTEHDNRAQTDTRQQKQLINEDFELLHAEFMCKPWQRLVSHRLVLLKEFSDRNKERSFLIGGDCAHGNSRFTIKESGIHFLS